jgi:hypothetical protein
LGAVPWFSSSILDGIDPLLASPSRYGIAEGRPGPTGPFDSYEHNRHSRQAALSGLTAKLCCSGTGSPDRRPSQLGHGDIGHINEQWVAGHRGVLGENSTETVEFDGLGPGIGFGLFMTPFLAHSGWRMPGLRERTTGSDIRDGSA